MAESTRKWLTGPASSQLTARQSGGAVATVGDDSVRPLPLEYESPSATLLALPVPFRSRFVIWIIASMFAVIMVVVCTFPIDHIVSTKGKVVPVEPTIVVQPLEISIVRSIEVKEGQVVHKGDVLARLDPTFTENDAASTAQQAQSLKAQVDRLQAELDGRTYVSDGTPASELEAMMYTQRHAEFTYKMVNYQQQIDSLKAKLDQAKSDVAAYTARLKVATLVESKRRQLEREQFGSQLDALAAMDNRVEMARLLEYARQTALGAEQDFEAMISERDGAVQSWRNDTGTLLSQQQRTLFDMQDQADKNKLRHELVVLRADRDAIVLSIAPVSVGSVLQPSDQFFTLVPVDSPTEIETQVDGSDAGFVSVGDPVTIKFQTFPYFTYGIARGKIRSMSPDSFDTSLDQVNSGTGAIPSTGGSNQHSSSSTSNPPSSRTEAARGSFFYRSRITIDQLLLHDLPPGFRVMPGMSVQADIKVGTRTVIQSLLSSVIPGISEGMHEP